MEVQAVWQQLLAKLEKRLPENELACWITCIQPRELRDGSLHGEVPSRVHLQQIRTRFEPEIARALSEVLGAGSGLTLSVNPAKIRPERTAGTRPFSPAYTFENFVTGLSNWMAYKSSQEAASHPGERFSPLFLYGGVGLGKTHLATAIANHLSRSRSPARIRLLSGEAFANEMIRALRTDGVEAFRAKLRQSDVLIVDDVEFFAGKERMQEEFFHTFNALHAGRKQIVLVSDQPPRDIPDLEERLRNRFESGLITDIQKPELSLRLAILAKKAAWLGLNLPADVAQLIATKIVSSVRELEGALHRLAAACEVNGRVLDLGLATRILRPILRTPPPRTLDQVQRLVAERFRIPAHELLSRGRIARLRVPRQVAMYLARKRTEATYAEIATGFGSRNHSTVIHAIKSVEERRSAEPEFAAMLDGLEAELVSA